MSITRRGLIFGGLAAGGATLWNADKIAVAFGKEAGLCDQSPSNLLRSLLPDNKAHDAGSLYPEIYASAQFTLVGDTNHTDLRIQDYFYSDENITHMLQAGVKNVCIEYNISNQPLFDDLQSGKITPEDFVIEKYRTTTEEIAKSLMLQSRLRTAQGIHKMAQSGIKVHCSDMRYVGHDVDERALRFQEGAYDFHEDMCDNPNGITMKGTIAYVVTNPIQFLFNRNGAKDLNLARVRDNEQIANLIKEQCGNERSVIFFGHEHFNRSVRSIASRIGIENATRISIYGDRTYVDPPKLYSADIAHFVEEAQLYNLSNRRNIGLSAERNSPKI